jgi:hypothetical protein
LLVAAGAPLTAVFAAAPQADAAKLYACVKKQGGSMRLVSARTKCRSSERKVSWSTSGAAGKNGATGANGKDGTNGANGKEGPAGQPQKAVTFSATLAGGLDSPETPLFTLGGTAVKLVCFNFNLNFSRIEAQAPVGSFATTGMVATDASGEKSPEAKQKLVQDVALSTSPAAIIELISNEKEPFANLAHVNGSIATPTSIVLWDAFLRTAQNPEGCTVRGTALSVPL